MCAHRNPVHTLAIVGVVVDLRRKGCLQMLFNCAKGVQIQFIMMLSDGLSKKKPSWLVARALAGSTPNDFTAATAFLLQMW